jgi:hypothetical protein
VALFFCSCDDRIKEGEITYRMSYPYEDTTGLVGHILPKEMTVIFKGTKTKTEIASGRILNLQIISDDSDQSIEMRLIFGDKHYYTVLTDADRATLLSKQPEYQIELTGVEDSVVGIMAKEYRVIEEGSSVDHNNAWFTERLRPDEMYFYSSYAGIKGVPLIYEIEQYDVIMRITAVNFTGREVLDEEFARGSDLVEVEFEKYYGDVQELFDVLMDDDEPTAVKTDTLSLETDSTKVDQPD